MSNLDYCLEKRVANQIVDSHVYVRIPINHYPQFEKLPIYARKIWINTTVLNIYANGKNTGCLKRMRILMSVLAYAKTWGWQETIINGKSKQKRVLLVESMSQNLTRMHADRVTTYARMMLVLQFMKMVMVMNMRYV